LENVYYTQVCTTDVFRSCTESLGIRDSSQRLVEGVGGVAYSRRGLQGSPENFVVSSLMRPTLRFGGYGVELQSHATLARVVNKLPNTLRSRWMEYSTHPNYLLASVFNMGVKANMPVAP
jgi:hypothetical protein